MRMTRKVLRLGALAGSKRLTPTLCFATLLFTVSPPAKANSIAVTYSTTTSLAVPPVVVGTTLILQGVGTGSLLSSDLGLNAIWNPYTWEDHGVADLTTGLLSGTFSMVFADGATLQGNLFEDVSALIATNGVGPFTQTLSFTGGTAEFTGATGLFSGSGIGGATSTVSGSGTLNAPAVPEPPSATMLVGALAFLLGTRPRYLPFFVGNRVLTPPSRQ
jgi:hypothetical protein